MAADRGVLGVPSVPARPSLSLKLVYGVGEIANTAKTTLFGLFLLFFYTTVMGLPGTLVGVAAVLGLTWDAAIDPYIGHASDRLRRGLGRRHTPMLAGALTLGVTFWALFSPPPGLTVAGLFAWALVASLLTRLTSSLFVIPYHALGAELSDDYHDRTSVTGIRGICGLAGTLAAVALAFGVYFPSQADGADAKLGYAGYPAMGLAVGLLMTAAALGATLGTLGTRARGRAAESAGPVGSVASAGVWRDFAVALASRSFRMLFLSFALAFVATVANGTLAIHYLTYFAQVADSQAMVALQVAFYLGALLGVVVWLRTARRVEKRWLYLAGALATALLMLSAYLLVGPGRPLGTGDARPVIVGQALAGFFGSLFWIMPHSMLADVADEDALEHGRRREGIFFGILSFGQQLSTGLAALLTGVLLDRFAGLVPGQAAQSAATAERIGALFGLLPAGLMLAAGLLILGYSLDRRRVAGIQAELAGRRPVLAGAERRAGAE